jgi:hypothetical protein
MPELTCMVEKESEQVEPSDKLGRRCAAPGAGSDGGYRRGATDMGWRAGRVAWFRHQSGRKMRSALWEDAMEVMAALARERWGGDCASGSVSALRRGD